MLVILAVWPPPKVLGLIGNMSNTLDIQMLLADRVGRHGTIVLMMWHSEGGGTMRNI